MNAVESENVMFGLATSRCRFTAGEAQPARMKIAASSTAKLDSFLKHPACRENRPCESPQFIIEGLSQRLPLSLQGISIP